jgi:type VI secretion system secreted protein VgrG
MRDDEKTTPPSATAGESLAACTMACTTLPPLDKSKYPAQRKKHDSGLKKAFPNLGNEYEVLAPETMDYNCIAHTLGKDKKWVAPETVPAKNPLTEMDKKYATQSYKRSSSMDFSYTSSKKKVVVYAIKNPDGSIKKVTHGAIQDKHGTWESKLGGGPLIRHKTPDALNGTVYGEPVAVYEK